LVPAPLRPCVSHLVSAEGRAGSVVSLLVFHALHLTPCRGGGRAATAGSRAAACASAGRRFVRNEANSGVSSLKFEVSSEAGSAKQSQFPGGRRPRNGRLGSFVQTRLQDRVNAVLRTGRASAGGRRAKRSQLAGVASLKFEVSSEADSVKRSQFRGRESRETADWVRLYKPFCMDRWGGLW